MRQQVQAALTLGGDMGLLHRLFASHAAAVWETETRLMRRMGLMRPPSAVQWIATHACDLRCPHCYSRAGRRAADELSTDQTKRLVIDELVALNRPTFVIAGGEPLLRPDFAELIAYTHERGIPWALHTHGGRVEALQAVFAKYPPKMAAVSLDGPPQWHDRFRGRPGSFDRALRAISVLKQTGCPEVVAGTTVTRDNADRLAEMFGAVLESGADSWGLHLIAPEGRAGEHARLMPTADQLQRVAAFARRRRSVMHIEMDNEWGSAGADDAFYRDGPFLCGAGRFSCVVSVTGEVMPCTTTDHAASEGNVRDRRLSEIWANGFADFRGGGCGSASDGDECWLQSRHGRSPRRDAFTPLTLEGAST